MMQVAVTGDGATRTAVPLERVEEFALHIVEREGRLLWASREDRELTVTRAGRYITFTSDAGFVRVIDPLFDGVRESLRATDPTEAFDYIEVMYYHTGLIVYFGRGTGLAGSEITRPLSFRLLRSSAAIPNRSLLVAVFAGVETDEYNRTNCERAADLFQRQPGVQVRYWCEAIR